LLQFVLEKLWDKQKPRLLTHQGYEKICGGSQNINLALANYAEEVYAEFSQQGKEIQFKRVLLCLVTPGEKAEDTRRVATRNEIGEDNWRDIVTVLANERLVVTSRHEQTQEETVEIIHEAIIQHWQRLKQWIDEYRSELIQLREIEAAAQKWHDQNKPRHELWQGKKLSTAKAFQNNKDRIQQLSLPTQNFLQASGKQQFANRLRLVGMGLVVPGAIGIFSVLNIQKAIEIDRNIQIIRKSKADECPANAIAELIKHEYEFKNIGDAWNGKNLSCSDLSSANLKSANLQSVNLKGANLRSVNGINLNGINLNGVNLNGVDLSHTNFTGVNLKNAILKGAILNSTDLKGVDLQGANLKDANLSFADLEGINLTYTNLQGTNLTGTNLKGADLAGTILTYTNLLGANLEGTNLKGANLSFADLAGTNLTYTNLQSANLEGANLKGADLTDVYIGIEPTQVSTSIKMIKASNNWQKAKFSEELRKKLGLK
jgi:uncharacterized protein YjbI with pentapeptide repeats